MSLKDEGEDEEHARSGLMLGKLLIRRSVHSGKAITRSILPPFPNFLLVRVLT